MKVLFFTVSLMIVLSIQSLSQMHDRPPQHMRDKLNQLEKIKLIEVLAMDEETTLRFFSRRNGHKVKIDELVKRTDEIITQMEVIFKAGRVYTEAELKSLIEEANTIHTEIVQTKSDESKWLFQTSKKCHRPNNFLSEQHPQKSPSHTSGHICHTLSFVKMMNGHATLCTRVIKINRIKGLTWYFIDLRCKQWTMLDVSSVVKILTME